MQEKWFSRLEETYPEMVSIRRDLHMYPELSFKEEHTPQKVAQYLRHLGIEVRTGVGGRGVIGLLRGGKLGKTVALRADFDALPIQDEKEVEYKSRISSVMHACGHDIHTAALLGVAKVLSDAKEELTGNVVFLHQFAEEVIPGGAKQMIEDGCLEGVDVVYGAHVYSEAPVGQAGTGEGYLLAACDQFDIEIHGKGGHASSPHTTVDPIVVGSQIVLNLQQIISRRVDPKQQAVVTVSSFTCGQDVYNVIPDKVHLKGSVRTFEEDVRDLIEKSIGQIVKSAGEGAGVPVEYTYQRGYPSVWNHPTEVQRVLGQAKRILGDENVFTISYQMASEDFAYYLQHRPGALFFVGGRNPELQAVYPHHHPKFDVDERAMLHIGKIFIATVFDYLSASPR